MADAVIGALRVLLGVDTAAFSSGLDGAQKEVAKFATALTSNLGKAATAAGVALTAAAGGIAFAIQHSINQMDELSKASQKFGVPIERLSALRLAAELSDVSIEQLGKSMSLLSKNMAIAVSGGVTPAASAFMALGISLDTLKQNDPSKVLEAVAARFADFEDGATKTALAVAIFGKAGAELIPLLNMGASGLKQMREEAAQFGAVISKETGKAAEDFNDNLKRFGVIQSGIANQISAVLLPALVDVTNQMIKWAKENDVVNTAAQSLLRVIALLVDNFRLLGQVIAIFIGAKIATAFIEIAISVVKFASAIYSAGLAATLLNAAKAITIARVAAFGAIILWATGNMEPFIEKLKEIGTVVANMVPEGATKGITEGLSKMGIDLKALTGDLSGLGTAGKDTTDALDKLKKKAPLFDPNAAGDAKKFTEELLKIGLKARELRGDFDGLAPGFVAAAIQLKLIKDTGEGFSGTLDTLTPKMQQLNTALLGLFGAQLTKEALSPWQEFEKQIVRIQMAFDAGKISQDVFADASVKAAAKMTETYGQFASTAAGNFATFFNQFAQGNATMFAVSKAFSISQAIINTYVGATKALAEAGPILGPILAASLVASGLAAVAKIVAEKPAAKMALGGSFAIKGAGGIDSQMVPIMATPGEKVSVDQNKYGQQASAKTITLQGLKPKEYYRGDVLRDFVDNLNEAIGDGLKIKLA